MRVREAATANEVETRAAEAGARTRRTPETVLPALVLDWSPAGPTRSAHAAGSKRQAAMPTEP